MIYMEGIKNALGRDYFFNGFFYGENLFSKTAIPVTPEQNECKKHLPGAPMEQGN